MYCAGDYHANLGTIGAAIQDARSTKKTALDALAAQVAELKAKVEAGVDPAEVLAGLEGIESGVKAIYEAPVE